MINSLILGNKSFPVNLIQAPLAGISCAPFRLLTWHFSKPAFTCTEMISCKALMRKSLLTQLRYIKKIAGEGPVCFQLFGNDPKELAEATKIVTDLGADLVDLNCGCPVKKVRSQGAGSKLLSDPSKIYHLIKAMKQNTTVPVSIKIRIAEIGNEKQNAEIAKVVADAGVDFLVVHGRSWIESYGDPCRYEYIKFYVDELNIPVIGNGNIKDLDSLKKMFATGCAGAMIGRAGVGQPWLIGKLIAEMQNKPFVEPSREELCTTFLDHVTKLIDFLGSERLAILQARMLAKYYVKGLPHNKEFCVAINKCQSFAEIKRAISSI